jgi:hypothetical protein
MTTMATKPGASARAPKKTPDADGVSQMVRYSARATERICERLAKGEAWQNLCKEPGMPSYSVFYDWQRRHAEFAEAVAIARQIGADFKADKALEVASKATSATVQADRLHVGTLLKHAALTAPRRWGARAEAPESGREKVVLEIRVRRFERVVGPDGRAFVRELKPEGEAPKRRRGKQSLWTNPETEDGQ